MRRFRDRRPAPYFRKGELLRMGSMILMLAVLWMIMVRARDASTWRWLTGDDEETAADGEPGAGASPAPVDPAGGRPAAHDGEEAVGLSAPTGPNDQDVEEQEAIEEEFQAVSDKAPLAAVEMPAYWRLATWASHSPAANLKARARRDRVFTHFLQAPAAHRGELVRLRLHVRRTVSFPAPADNPLGVKDVYEAWGRTDESRAFPYVVVFTERPKGFPIKDSVREDATFYGYFLKLLSYEAHDGKERVAPLLIGRLVPVRTTVTASTAASGSPNGSGSSDWSWPMVLLAVVGVGYIGLRVVQLFRRTRRRHDPALAPSAEDYQVEQWLAGPPDEDPSYPSGLDVSEAGPSPLGRRDRRPPPL
jgi:hypothetical protein